MSNLRARAVDFLALAATPTFAAMALLTAAVEAPDMHGSHSPSTTPLNGMVVMYLLMSVFHSPPWLKRVASISVWRSTMPAASVCSSRKTKLPDPVSTL